jgi:CHAT domain-containing protein
MITQQVRSPLTWRSLIVCFFSLSMLLLCPILASAAQPVEDAPTLVPNAPIKREIKGEEKHTYLVGLEGEQFTVVSVKPENTYLFLTLTAPDGRKLVQTSQSEIALLAEAHERYVVEVRPQYKDGPIIQYEINLATPRPATAQDRARAAGERTLGEGDLLARQAKTSTIREAIEKFLSAVSLFREAQQPVLETVALLRIGQNYLNLQEKMPTARDYLNQALRLARANKDRINEALTLRELGRTYFEAEEPQAALGYYAEAMKLFETLNYPRGKANTFQSMALASSALENYAQALAYFQQALTLYRTYGDRSNEAAAYNNLAMEYKEHGELQKALENYNQALPLSRLTGYVVLELKVLNNLGITYKDLGDYDKARDLYEQSLVMCRRLGNVVGEAQVLNNIGNVYRAEGENQKALDYYQQALAIFGRLKIRSDEAMAFNNIGAIYLQMNEPEKALPFHEQARDIRISLGDRRGEASALNQTGRAWYQLGDLAKARGFLQQALEIRRQIQDPLGEVESLFQIARVELAGGQWAESRASIETVLAKIESLRASISNPGLRASYLASTQEAYEFYIALLMRQHQQSPMKGYVALALQASERARARSLLELLVEARADIREGVAADLLERERRLQQQLDTKSARLTQLLNGKHSEAQKADAEKELSELLTGYENMQAQIRRNSPRYAALTQPQPLSATTIQQQLDNDTVFLEFSLGEPQSYLWAVTRTTLTSYPLPSRKEIAPLARRVYETLTAPQPRKGETEGQYQTRIAEAEANWQTAGASLSHLLFGQLAGKLQNEWKGKRLVVVASGALEYIPFAALPMPVASGQWPVVSGQLSPAGESAGSGEFIQGKQTGSAIQQTSGESIKRGQPPAAGHRPATTDHQSLITGYRPLIADHEIINLPSASVLAVIRNETGGRRAANKSVAVMADPVFETGDPRVLSAVKKSSEPLMAVRSRGGVNEPAQDNQSSTGTAPSVELQTSLKSFQVIRVRGGFSRLPFSREEANAIIALTPKHSSMQAIDFAANRQTVTSGQLGHFRIIHFATHGLLNSEHPELSGLVLSLVDEQGRPLDGFLRMHEIYNLQLPADLVVLSACQTALGKEIRGEGLVGLTRGFIYAGAQRVVASLWQVDDLATAELMKRFYRAMLKDGLRPAQALRTAQLEMASQKRWASPYFWAAFTLQGEWK